MVGIFNSSIYDRAIEQQLNKHLDKLDRDNNEVQCPYCGVTQSYWEVEDNDGRCVVCNELLDLDEDDYDQDRKMDEQRDARIVHGEHNSQ